LGWKLAPAFRWGFIVASNRASSIRLALAFAACLAAATQARAADLSLSAFEPLPAWHAFGPPAAYSFHGFDPPANYTGEAGLRFWYGKASTSKNLFDSTGASLVSRLGYSGLSIFSAEAFGRFDLNTGWFLKGFIGGGGFRNGTLTDEDFPPGISPYSATLSVIDDSFPVYSTVDVGYTVLRGADFRVGAFLGYNYLRQVVSAQGCGQVGFNPLICGLFPVPGTVKVITQSNTWEAMRLGLEGTFDVTDRLKLSAEAAWLPFVGLNGTDAHWLRIGKNLGDFTGPVPEDGTGWGIQLEGTLSYRLTDYINVGVGGRYWHMQTAGQTHFEGHVVGFLTSPQPVEWKTDSYGVFLQTSLKLGPYPVIGRN
jgi:hypothetical protein